MTASLLVFVALAAAAWLSFRLARRGRKRDEETGEGVPTRFRWHEEPQPDQANANVRKLCRCIGERLDANIVLFRTSAGVLSAVAHAPHRHGFGPIDRIAMEWALTHLVPTGRGTGLLTGSDWQFHPVFFRSELTGLLAVAGRHGRALDLHRQPWLLEDVLACCGRTLDRLGAAEAGQPGTRLTQA